MHSSRLLRTLARVAVGATFALALTLSACGASSGGPAGLKALKIATELPVGGDDASAASPTQYGADLAVDQNKDLGKGYTLSIVHKNDEGATGADPSIGASNITALINDPAVMAVVGPFNSGVAAAEMPIVNNSGGPALISPANTNPGLTLTEFAAARGFDFAKLHPAGKPDFYFRIPANDFVQGAVETQVALSAQVNCHKAFIVDDNTPYGKGLADYFTTHYTQAGGTTVGSRTSITPDQVSSFPQLATTIKSSGADCTFYGGVTSQGGAALKKALVAAGYPKAMISGDGIAADPGWLATAGAAAVGTVATTPAPDPSTLTGDAATKFKADYATFVTGKPNNALIPYSAYGYVAAMIEITAIKTLINADKPVTRLAVRDEIAKIQYSGITGNVSFDANGDNAGAKIFAVYAVVADKPDAWTYQTTITA